MDKALAELIRISNMVGKDSRLVQGGGGNTSVKSDDGQYMYVKASGTALKDMSAKQGWRRLEITRVLEIIKDMRLSALSEQDREMEVVRRLLGSCEDNILGEVRPSIESHLHAMLEKVVIHLHPLVVSAYVNAKGGKQALEKLFKKEKFPPLWVGYTNPGYGLAKKMSRMVNKYQREHGRKPRVIFLEKHGVFITGKSAAIALREVKNVIRACESRLKKSKPGRTVRISLDMIRDTKLVIRKAYFEATGYRVPVHYMMNDTVQCFMKRRDAGRLLNAGALAPDELAYVDGPALWVDKVDAVRIIRKLTKQIAAGDKPASTFLVKGLGLFSACDSNRLALIEEITTGSMMIRGWAAGIGGLLTLTKKQQDFVNQWEAESFRRAMTERANSGDLKGKISIVTGAGSGLGRSIAIGLARAGALVGLADIDLNAAQETGKLIQSEMPGVEVLPIICNVTDEESVVAGFESLLEHWGGLDVLVNAAGVAPAYPLVDTPVDKWRFALEVNLTGYMLMAKYAAQIFISQEIGGSMVNISSKTGVDASKNNSAYNATKAGELHLTRGWAMELGQYGIRVNNVCPGNVFEGSKIWNPTYIKECARKYGIKPEEVIPYYVSRTMLNKEIKGQDIADAVVFLASEKARRITAQTLVADAGQAMVR